MSEQEQEFSFRDLFTPFTNSKAIYWIIFVGLIVFGNALFNGFVGDDFGQLVDNNIVHSLYNIPYFFLGGTFGNSNGGIIGLYYKPLLLTIYAVFYSLFGTTSFYYHLFQLLIHICNTILVFFLLSRFFKKPISFFLSLLFLLHPINADTVDYVANLQDVLFVFWGLLALMIVFFKKDKPLAVFGTSLFLLLSLLSKETGIVFAFVILSYLLLFEREKLKSYSLSIITIIILYALAHFFVIGPGFSNNQPFPIMRASLFVRFLTMPAIIAYYFNTFFVPIHLSLDHQWIVTHTTFSQFYLPLLITVSIGSLVGLLFFSIRRNNHLKNILIFFGLWLFVGIVVHLQIIPLDYTVANRWFYFPIIGLLGIFGLVLTLLQNKYLKLFYLVFILLLISLSLRTIVRNINWVDGLTLAKHDLQYSSEDYSLESYLGVQYYNMGQYDQAQKHFTKSTQLAPYWDLNWNYLGEVFERKGEIANNNVLLERAKSNYQVAMKNSVHNDTPFISMAHLLVFSEDRTAEKFLKDALQKFPHSSGLWYYAAILELSKNNKDEALKDARNAYIVNVYNEDAKALYEALLSGTPVKIQIQGK